MDEAALEDLLTVVPQRDGSFIARCLTGARGRMFGGQVAAQALRAATLAAPGDRAPHSLHSCFLRPGDPSAVVTYVVTVLKDGRSLTTFRVDAYQDERTIFTALASFHVDESSLCYQAPAPEAPDAMACPGTDYVPAGTNPDVRSPLEFRYPDPASTGDMAAPPEQLTWLRSRARLPDDFSLHACALTYASDLTLTRTAHMPLRTPGFTRLGASLDHSLWFHRRFRVDEWLLFAQETTSYVGARALSHGRLFTTDGALVASVSQEALIRVQPEN
jgi:acyl-CoA thioesterase-2